MEKEVKKFEDRKGSNFEMGKDRSTRPSANEKKFVDRKEEQQRKKYGIKPTDTEIDVANLVARDVLSKVIAEEPKQELHAQETVKDDDADEAEKDKQDKIFDPKEELRIKMMQFLNPRIVKSKEMKNYMNRTSMQEELVSKLNDFASHKLDLLKAFIALEEGKKENKEKEEKF